MSRILVIDDEPDVRLALSVTLEEEGHEVFEGADGRAAFRLAASLHPELILLDIGMPGMDGFECLRLLKEDSQTARIPVVMVTALGDPREMARAKALGAVDFVTKPWFANDLIRRSEAAIAAGRVAVG